MALVPATRRLQQPTKSSSGLSRTVSVRPREATPKQRRDLWEDVPQGFAKVEPEQIRQQVNAVAQAALLIVQQVMKSAQTNANTNTAPPSSSAAPAGTPAR